MSYDYPKTVEEWWNTLDGHWADLYNIMVKYLPKEDLAQVDTMRTLKDTKLVHSLNNTWANAPDSLSIHSIPGWGVLCDLCSESYLVCEGEE